VLLCLGIFVFEVAQDPAGALLGRPTEFEFRFGFIGFLVPYEPWRVLTGPFLHGAPWHLLNNVFFLLLLGSWLEEDIGPLRWTLIFITGVLAAEALVWMLDQFALVIGVSGGLMALGAAGIRLERQSPFASERRRLCVLTIGVTLLLGLAFPKLGSSPAHAAGALTGFLLTFVLPQPLRIRTRRAAEMSTKAERWAQERASIAPALPDEQQLDLRPTLVWRAGLVVAAIFFVGVGASTALQSHTIHDRISAIASVGVGVLTAAGGLFLAAHESLRYLHGDRNGLTGFRWRRTVGWTDIETFYPGTVYSGLFKQDAVGWVLEDGSAFGTRALGHPPRPLARRLEAIRLSVLLDRG
jgi:membrane associated rhomboid family serine protease